MVKARLFMALLIIMGYTLGSIAFEATAAPPASPELGGSQSSSGSEKVRLRPELLNPKTVEPITPEEFRGLIEHWQGEIVVVNLWATWCIPCIREFPDLSKLQEQYKNRKVRVIGISVDDPEVLETKVKPFVKDRAPSFAIYQIKHTQSDKLVSVLDPAWDEIIPTTYVLDQKGELSVKLVGRRSYEQFEEAVIRLLTATAEAANKGSVMSLE